MNESARPGPDSNAKTPTEGDYTETEAARVGGRATEPPAADPDKINFRLGRQPPISEEEWIARHLALAPRISDERWARIDAVFALMEDQQRSETVKPSQRGPG